MLHLDLLSERVAPTGNASADGLKKVLGAPVLDRLSVVVRESVQNSWDARLPGSENIKVLFNYRLLNEREASLLRYSLCRSSPSSTYGDVLRKHLGEQQLAVLEVADYGTSGLTGPEHADEVPALGEPAHFVDFVRNVGKTHDQVGGGTYGFGKASFYALSRISTIWLDTVTTNNGVPIRRAMLAGLGERYEDVVDGTHVNFTGRHWWGTKLSNDRIAPLQDMNARLFAESLGLPHRTASDTGTTIGIVMPRLSNEDIAHTSAALVRSVLLNFWPKMVPTAPNMRPAIQFSIKIHGEEKAIPDPALTPPFNHFVTALQNVRGTAEEEPIINNIVTGGRHKVHLGRLGLQPGPCMPRPDALLLGNEPASEGEDLFRPGPISHVADMRSGELVVRYTKYEPLANSEWEWAGVFKTTSEESVETAFALSETPTHDAWNENSLEDREHQRWLRSRTRTVNQILRKFLTPQNKAVRTGESLGRASAALGRMLPGMESQYEANKERSSPRQARKLQSPKGRFSTPHFVQYLMHAGVEAALFETSWNPSKDSPPTAILHSEARVLLEGRLVDTDELPDGLIAPRVLAVTTSESQHASSSGVSRIRFSANKRIAFQLVVSLENNLPSGVSVSLEPSDAK